MAPHKKFIVFKILHVPYNGVLGVYIIYMNSMVDAVRH